jgi:hypothetical protein
MILLIVVELLPPNIALSPLISEADVDYVPEYARIIKQNEAGGPFRSIVPTYLTPEPDGMEIKAPNRSIAWRVLYNKRSGRNLDGIRQKIQYSLDQPIDHLNSRESAALANRSINLPTADKITLLANLNCRIIPAIGEVKDPRLTLLGTIDTHSNLDHRLYRLDDALPRAYFASRVIGTRSPQEAMDRIFESSSVLHNTVILDTLQAVDTRVVSAGSNPVRITRYENNRVTCQVKADSTGYLVLLDSWYPGWNAYLDGRKVEVLRANYAFRAVAVTPGTHQVEFVFRPTLFYLGAAITCITLLIGTAVALSAAFQRRSSPAATSRNG